MEDSQVSKQHGDGNVHVPLSCQLIMDTRLISWKWLPGFFWHIFRKLLCSCGKTMVSYSLSILNQPMKKVLCSQASSTVPSANLHEEHEQVGFCSSKTELEGNICRTPLWLRKEKAVSRFPTQTKTAWNYEACSKAWRNGICRSLLRLCKIFVQQRGLKLLHVRISMPW